MFFSSYIPKNTRLTKFKKIKVPRAFSANSIYYHLLLPSVNNPMSSFQVMSQHSYSNTILFGV